MSPPSSAMGHPSRPSFFWTAATRVYSALWVYKDRSLAPEQYPETTTLQRSLKTFLPSGGTFQDGLGFLLDDPFPEKPPQDSASLSGCPIYD